MSQEITVTVSLSAYKPAFMVAAVERSEDAIQFTMAGTTYAQGNALIATSATLIQSAVNNPHWCFFRNLDETNFITIRFGASGADLIKLKPGEVAVAPLKPGDIYAVADTAAAYLEYLMIAL